MTRINRVFRLFIMAKKVKTKKISAKKYLKNKDKIIFSKPVLGLESYLVKNSKNKAVAKPKSVRKNVRNRLAKLAGLKIPRLADSSKKASLTKQSKKKKQSLRSQNKDLNTFWTRHPKSLIISTVVITAFGGLTYFFILKDLPNPYDLAKTKPPMTTIIRDRNGIVLYRVYKQANRVELSFNELPEIVKNSTIAIEDSNFYNHLGVDFKAIVRAFLNNVKAEDMDYYQGASTIPQQLVKNRLLTNQKSYQRKLKEVLLSFWTEAIYSKQEILTMYLNTVGYGGPAYGIEAASQMYFNKSAKKLTLAEAAFLAGLPAAPTTLSPYGMHPDLAHIRQKQVLERMHKLGMISEDDYLEAVNEKLALAPQKINILAPHFVMYVKDELVKRFGEKAVEEGGFDVTTTLDLNVQNKAQEIATKNIESIKNVYRINNAGVLITKPVTGEILAMVGSVDYFDTDNSGHYNATLASRQPGSSFKPFTYGYAFDHGYSPTTTLLDAPVVYKNPGSKDVYAPVNYDGKFHGNVTIRSALANSYNIPAVKALEKMGVENVKKLGIDMGLKSLENAGSIGLSLTLGGAEVTMLEMAKAYGTIANMGVKKELKPILSIKDVASGDLTAEFYRDQDIALASEVMAEDKSVIEDKNENRVLSPLSAYWLTDILSDNKARFPAFGRYAKL